MARRARRLILRAMKWRAHRLRRELLTAGTFDAPAEVRVVHEIPRKGK